MINTTQFTGPVMAYTALVSVAGRRRVHAPIGCPWAKGAILVPTMATFEGTGVSTFGLGFDTDVDATGFTARSLSG